MIGQADSMLIRKGGTFSQVIRWETDPRVYKPITAATKAGPCVLTVTSHGLPDGWMIRRITAVGGMSQLNTHAVSGGRWLRTSMGMLYPDGFRATVIDPNTIELNQINASGFGTYTSGGVLEYNSPVTLTGYTARMQIRDAVESTIVLLEMSTSAGGITLDATAKTITLSISATDTAAITWATGVTTLEMTSPTGVVTPLIVNQPVVVLETDITR